MFQISLVVIKSTEFIKIVIIVTWYQYFGIKMERWLQILLGTVFSSVGLFIFYLIFEKFVKSWIGSRGREITDGVDRIQLRVKHGGVVGGRGDVEEEEMENLVYEEYDTEDHEVLAIAMENEMVTVGVSLFLSDR